MPGMEFEYDEQGTTFYYFVLAVLVIILLPWSIILWRRKKADAGTVQTGPVCNCELCVSKRDVLKQKPVSNKLRSFFAKLMFVVLWILFFACVYKVSTIEMEFKEFDPYGELGIDSGASAEVVRKAYRDLSKIHHPDRGGDGKRFIRIAKAYETLTNEETRKNWEEYGNPDGPGAMQFGIALPKWLVEKKNSMFVLAAYAFAFMIVLPTAVGIWWYRSIRFSAEHVLLETEEIYKYFFRKHPNCILKKIIHILSVSREFGHQWNQEIVERPSDNIEMPKLIRKLPNVVEQPREMPYILKTRALIHAHLSRIPLQSTLEQDRRYIVRKCPLLVGEMSSLVSQFNLAKIMYNLPANIMPRLSTVEAVMQLHSMIVQACWDNKSNLIQLPHFTEEFVYSLSNRRGKSIRTINDLANMAESDRRQALRSLSDDQYRDVIEVLRNFPLLDVEAKPEVIDVDDEDPSITAGSIVTLVLKIRRGSLGELMTIAALNGPKKIAAPPEGEQVGEENGADGKQVTKKQESKPWQKHGKKKGGKNSADPRQHNKAKSKQQQQQKEKKLLPANASETTTVATTPEATTKKCGDHDHKCADHDHGKSESESESESEKENKSSSSESGDENTGGNEVLNESERDEGNDANSPATIGDGKKTDEDDEDERRWRRFNEATKRDNAAAMAGMDASQAPIVHCPYLPIEKRESWWVYICDRKQQQLLTLPQQINGLKASKSSTSAEPQQQQQDDDRLELPLKFRAPEKPGIYQYTVCVRSDSYLGVDAVVNLKLDVRTAPAVEVPPVDSESEKEGSGSEDEEADNHDGVRRRKKSESEASDDDASESESESD